MHIHLDVLGGIAGDMFLSAVLDARPDLRDPIEAAMRAAGLPDDWRIRVEQVLSAGICATQVSIEGPEDGDPQHHDHHHHDHEHHHHHPAGAHHEIRQRIEAAALDSRVRDTAIAIFQLLAEVEARIHGVSVDEVHFHELAGWDSVADIVGAAQAIALLGADSWSMSTLPIGSGRVKTAHGPMPVPAPATARLLEGFRVIDDGIPGERITPTGAAILRYLNPSQEGAGGGVLSHQGYGAGHKQFDHFANVLRLVMFEPAAPNDVQSDRVAVVEFEVDDQTPEDLAVGLTAIRDFEGVLDLVQSSVLGKKGRMATSVRVLCRPERLEEVAATCFRQTTTIGLRHRVESRRVLARHETVRDTVRLKSAVRPGGNVTRKAELDDIAQEADDQAERAALRRRLEADDGC